MDTILLAILSALCLVVLSLKAFGPRTLFRFKLDLLIDLAVTIGLPLLFNMSTQAIFLAVFTGVFTTFIFGFMRLAYCPTKSTY